ncbi:M15 family metallopeptidase [Clostridium sp. LBM24168]
MKKMIFILAFIVLFSCRVKAEDVYSYNIVMKQDILCLMMAYPEYIKDVERDNKGNVYIIMKSGNKVLYDDKKEKNFDKKFFNTDIQDMMEQKYPLDAIDGVMNKNIDPGRLRVYPILSEVYGDSKNEVESNLEMVNLGYRKFQFNRNNGAARSLENAIKDIMPLAEKNSNILNCLFPCSGTFNYRNISGTNLRSPHSFAIAIDLARDRRDYWKWVDESGGSARIKSYPKKIVEAFEKNNFVWGGKWSHFDILHFEYRPEIIFKARYFEEKNNIDNKWFEGVPYKDSKIKSYIEKIDSVFG